MIGNVENFLESESLSQKYSLLYCFYDLLDGARDWKSLLAQNRVSDLDLVIAKRALKRGETKVKTDKIIYYGSPHAQ
jgi:hypothetical protein